VGPRADHRVGDGLFEREVLGHNVVEYHEVLHERSYDIAIRGGVQTPGAVRHDGELLGKPLVLLEELVDGGVEVGSRPAQRWEKGVF
jgi:hypothetical protein